MSLGQVALAFEDDVNGTTTRRPPGVSAALWEANLHTYRSFGFKSSARQSQSPPSRQWKTKTTVKKARAVTEKDIRTEPPHGLEHASVSPLPNGTRSNGLQLLYHIINSENPLGLILSKPQPDNIEVRIPDIQSPQNPSRIQTTLHQLEPAIFFIQYACISSCRNTGTCIHFQLCINRSQCPDGLVCGRCMAAKQEVMKAKRKCPLHQNPNDHNPCGSRPEDFLATVQQQNAYEDILRRSLSGSWAGDESSLESTPSLLSLPTPGLLTPKLTAMAAVVGKAPIRISDHSHPDILLTPSTSNVIASSDLPSLERTPPSPSPSNQAPSSLALFIQQDVAATIPVPPTVSPPHLTFKSPPFHSLPEDFNWNSEFDSLFRSGDNDQDHNPDQISTGPMSMFEVHADAAAFSFDNVDFGIYQGGLDHF